MTQVKMKNISNYEISNDLISDPIKLRNRANKDGYLFFKNLLDRKNNLSLKNDIHEICLKHDFLDTKSNIEKTIAKSGLNILPGSNKDNEYYIDVIKLRSLHLYAQSNELTNIFEILFESKVLNHSQNIVRTVFPQTNKYTTPPHQDYWYVGGSKNTWTTWIPLGDTPKELGTLAVGKETHYEGVIINRFKADGAGNYACDVPDEVEWVNGDMEAGDVLMFNCLNIHQATDNNTDRIRLSCDFRYQSVLEPVHKRSLTPHMQLITWDEIYKNWVIDDGLKYYWKNYDLTINHEIETDRKIN